eukprot:TRINITY_DN11758_c0_g1_i2.p1 TRINITY_DN11758_c0_g1~~TRINITY_DN11758_c0_g1_i2.p1  ORF type:complete len:137 (-),score=19.85 TRINITY_DN11758_c0_g1_i2:741-1151(-)
MADRSSSSIADEMHGVSSPSLEPVTTLCIRDLPCSMSQKRMTAELWMLGFGGRYDFLYLPCRGKSYLGFGFINFCTAADARSFAEVFKGYCFEDRWSEKRGFTEPSRVQGFEANIRQFTHLNTSSRIKNHGPWIAA